MIGQIELKSLIKYDPITGVLVRNNETISQKDPRVRIKSTNYTVNKLIYIYMTGKIPREIMYLDGDKTNNKWNNLEEKIPFPEFEVMTQELLKRFFSYDPTTGLFTRLITTNSNAKRRSVVSPKDRMKIKSKKFQISRMAFLYMKGYLPDEVLHLDHDKCNNKWDNLEEKIIVPEFDVITQEILFFLLDYDPNTGLFTRKITTSINAEKGTIAGTVSEVGYVTIRLGGKMHKAHRLAYLYMENWMPEEVDHIDHNRSNNKWDNLRDGSGGVNAKNMSIPSTNTSGTMGVSEDKRTGKWKAYLVINGVQILAKYFAEKQDAIIARREAEKEYGFHENHGKAYSPYAGKY